MCVAAVQDVEQQWLQNLRVLLHALEVEALEARQRNGVVGVVEQISKLPTLFPLVEPGVKGAGEGVGQRAERAETFILHLVEVLYLFVQVALLGCAERFPARRLG